MLRRQLGPKMDDLKQLRVKPVPTWCNSHSHMARAKASRTRIATSQTKVLPSRRRIRWRMRVASCAVPLSLGKEVPKLQRRKPQLEQKTANIVTRALEMELVGMVIYIWSVSIYHLVA
jgi:hypothetical protein